MINNPDVSLADIFRQYWPWYESTHKVTHQQRKAAFAIMYCRTEKMGHHLEKCSNPDCDHEVIMHNSCRNRMCNQCEANHRLNWITARLKELLPIPYYHFVSTLSPICKWLALYNQEIVYSLFFKATSFALNQFGLKERYLGAEIGFTSVLHTWGQRLNYHPHIHCIVTGGGLSKDKRNFRQLPYKKKFLFPVKAVSKLIGAHFVTLLKQAYDKGQLVFPGMLAKYSTELGFIRLCHQLSRDTWYCYAKRPFSGPEKVLEYMGRYTHRVAISNRRILKVEEDHVTFEWRDYKDDYKKKVMRLHALDFIHRFMFHVLPHGFRKVRYYGFLSTRERKNNIESIHQLLKNARKFVDEVVAIWMESISKYINHLCPICEKGEIVYYFNTS